MRQPDDAERPGLATPVATEDHHATDQVTSERTAADSNEQWIIRALRGDIKTEGAYHQVRITRELWRSGRLHGRPDIVAALNVGDNRCLDEADRFAEMDRTWEFEPSQRDPGTEAAFDTLTRGST